MLVIKPEDFIGRQFGHYQLVEFLKGGGFGLVYRAEHMKLHRKVALKLLKPELVANGEKVVAFEREASIIANLTHPKILDVYHYDVLYGIPFIVMPFIEQGSLLKLHPRGSRLNLETIVSFVTQIAEALQYAHDQKIVHRDIKPDNVLVGKHGLLLTDFGIAIAAHNLQSLSLQEAVGTLPYMAPEQFEEKAQTWSDQYSLAVVVYEWLCGKVPFSGGGYFEFYHKHKEEAPPSFKLQGVEVLPLVEAVVMKALAKEPKDRFASVQAFATALDQASQQQQQPIVVQQPIIQEQPVLSPLDKPPGTTIEIYRGHTSNVKSVAWSPDGKYIVSGSLDGTAHVWEATTGRKITEYKGHRHGINSVDWSPEGMYIASGEFEKVRIWEFSTSKLITEYNEHSTYVSSVAWSPNSKYIASSNGFNETEYIWEAATGKKITEYNGHRGNVFTVAWSPDGKYIASGSVDKTVHVWEAATGKLKTNYKRHIINEFADGISSVAWSPNGKYIASASGYKIAHVWEATTGRKITEYNGHSKDIHSSVYVAWSPNGKYIVSGADNTVHVWEAATGNMIIEYKGHSKPTPIPTYVHCVSWSPDGKYIVSGSTDNTAQVWVAPK